MASSDIGYRTRAAAGYTSPMQVNVLFFATLKDRAGLSRTTLTLPAEEQLILDAVRALARDRIAPHAAQYDRSGEFPWDNVKAINALGLNGMFVPAAYGGAGLLYAVYLYLTERKNDA